MNSVAPPIYAGERLSRNAAESMCQCIAVALFGEHSNDREEVAQNTHSLFGSLASFCDLGGGGVAFTDRGKHFKLDRGFQSFGALMGVDRLEN